ncbi:hypothetical protein COCSUDRAFT_60279 [Coccomyxa subellipsoidea C-169]|uniref:Uncharacterized protein n=1 Tax=Coccomyxa subellipsoidea (strain C-169) TaxID=574566 RepID=I0YIU0_COCSC|nr:hypothetical protein COCSUDRAFT_60279 [Coccomyxa subellipsoidea C-169]EIE18309.1 hypothetical protein COCSUDRAFT_60279 [Coccomyxa subellipsoidea C-169]|eukprot:XP_005642853.1 hypothetical protein COCSUDRAFT_60279 [Coccomyxa subellipsoidea C-169]
MLFNMTRWRRYKAGEVIFDTEAGGSGLATALHLMVEGVAVLTAKRDGNSATSFLYSGYIFNLAVCNVFGVYIGLERAPIEQVYASSGQPEVPGYTEGARSRDLVEALTEEELPPFSIRAWLKW